MPSPMRTPLATFVILLALVVCSIADGPLAFQAPEGWKVEHKKTGIDFYAVTGKTPDEGLLMFSPWPVPAKPEEIPAMVQHLADRFKEQAKKGSEFSLAGEEPRVEPFAGENCSGSYASFQLATSSGKSAVQTMFMMTVDGKVWNGQFTGSLDAWKQAFKLLKSIRKEGP